MASYDALNGAAAVFDRSGSDARLLVSGPDRTEWLQGLLTNDIGALARGQGCYAAYLTPQGRMIGDMRVFDRGEHVVLDVVATAREALLSRLDQFIIMEDVTLADVTAEIACIAVAGPDAAGRLAPHLGCQPADLAALPEYHQREIEGLGAGAFVASSRELGVPGFDVYLPAAGGSRLLEALREAGLADLRDDVATAARIEAGRPRFGVDMDTDTIPLEAGIENRAISFTKGCYVGQEIVIRVLHRGQGRVARRVCRLVSDAPASAGVDGDTATAALPWQAGASVSLGGKAVGRVTSAALSPRRDRLVAFAVLSREAMAHGTAVEVEAAEEWRGAVVEALAGEGRTA